MTNLVSFLSVFILLLPSSQLAEISDTEYKTYKDYKIVELVGESNDLKIFLDLVKKIDENLIFSNNQSVAQILVAPSNLHLLNAFAYVNNLETKLVVDDFSQIIAGDAPTSLRSKRFSWTAYYDVDDIYEFLKNTSKTYPKWAQVVIGGKSYENRQILGLRINTFVEKKKPAFLIESGIHAREWIAPAVTTYFINQLLTSTDPHIVALRDQFDWHIFPTINPDGYHYTHTTDRMWRKTRSKSPNGCYGADPNRNWDYNWMQQGATSNPCDSVKYAGSKPFSEVETKSFSSYITSVKNLQAYVGFHSYGEMLLVPFSDSTEHQGNYDDLMKIGKTSLEYGAKVSGLMYRKMGTAAEILYPVSGSSMDWVRHTLGTKVICTYELRGEYFQWPPSKIAEQGDEVTQMLLGLVTEANNLGYFPNEDL